MLDIVPLQVKLKYGMLIYQHLLYYYHLAEHQHYHYRIVHLYIANSQLFINTITFVLGLSLLP